MSESGTDFEVKMVNEMEKSDRDLKKEIEEMKADLQKQKKEIDKLKKEGKMRDTAESVLFKKMNTLTEDIEKMKGKMRSARTMKPENSEIPLDENIEAPANKLLSFTTDKKKGKEVTSLGKTVCEDSNEVNKDPKNLDLEKEKSLLENVENEGESREMNPEVAHLLAQNTPSKLRQMNLFNLEHFQEEYKPDLQWIIKSYSKKMFGKSNKIWSYQFPLSGHSLVGLARLKFRKKYGVYLSVELRQNTNPFERCPRHVKLLPNIYYILKYPTSTTFGQLSPHKCSVVGNCFSKKYEYSGIKFPSYFRDDSILTPDFSSYSPLAIEIYVEPLSMAEDVRSRDGILTWAIRDKHDNFGGMDKRKYGTFFHDHVYLYTGPRGHKVRVEIQKLANSRSDVRACVSFVVGEFHEELGEFYEVPSEFCPHVTTLTLLHPRDSQRNLSKAVKKVARDYSVDLDERVDFDQFSIDGKLIFKIVIEAI